MRAKTILTVLFLLAIGVAGLIFLKAMSLQTEAKGEGPEVLIAAAPLQPRTLLRAQDVTWQKLSGPSAPGTIFRPNEATRLEKPLLDEETRAAVYGAVLRASV